MTVKSDYERQAWKNLQKLYPDIWSNKDMFFAIFLGTMLGITLGMIFGIGFFIR